MSTEISTQLSASILEQVVIGGDLSKLTSTQRVQYYNAVCASVGLNPLTKPFDYITLNGKLTLYARRDATDQLRDKKQVSVAIKARELVDGIYVVTASAKRGDRVDESIGAVNIEGLKGEAKANAMMKAETKAKRRVTLSICGLGMLDETEAETVPGARKVKNMGRAEVVDPDTGEVNPTPQQPASSLNSGDQGVTIPAPAAGAPDETRDQTLTRLCKLANVNKIQKLAKANARHADELSDDDYMELVGFLQGRINALADRLQP